MSLKLVPRGPIDNTSALVQIMAWRIYVSFGFNDLNELLVLAIMATCFGMVGVMAQMQGYGYCV